MDVYSNTWSFYERTYCMYVMQIGEGKKRYLLEEEFHGFFHSFNFFLLALPVYHLTKDSRHA